MRHTCSAHFIFFNFKANEGRKIENALDSTCRRISIWGSLHVSSLVTLRHGRLDLNDERTQLHRNSLWVILYFILCVFYGLAHYVT
jgi:hypothetical protein